MYLPKLCFLISNGSAGCKENHYENITMVYYIDGVLPLCRLAVITYVGRDSHLIFFHYEKMFFLLPIYSSTYVSDVILL